MEQSHVDAATKNLKQVISLAIVIIVIICVVIGITTAIDSLLGFDLGYYIGMTLAFLVGIVIPVIIIILSSVALANLKKNPKLLFGVTIATLVMSLSMLALAYAIVSIGRSLVDDITEAGGGSTDHAMVITPRIVSLVLIIALIPIVIVMIVGAAKNIKIGQPYVMQAPAPGNASAVTRSVQPVETEGGVFCTQCGWSNNTGAKFCKKCGQAL